MNEYLLFYKISSNMVFLTSAKLAETEQNRINYPFWSVMGIDLLRTFCLAVFENYFPCDVNP